MEEERDLVIGFRATMVADDDSAEQTAIYRLRDVHVVIVERPGARSCPRSRRKHKPCLSWADGVAAAAARVMHAERP